MIFDTCALLFLPSGDPRLTRQTRERLARELTVWYCAISAFEIALKLRDKKLELPMKLEENDVCSCIDMKLVRKL